MLKGGCFCGHVRYEAGGQPFHATVCHCSMCRRVAGAPMVAWFSVPRDAFRIVAGTPSRFASSERGERSFCPRCGTPLTFEGRAHPDEIDITTVSLDDPEAVPPADQTQMAARLSWVEHVHELPGYPEFRPAS